MFSIYAISEFKGHKVIRLSMEYMGYMGYMGYIGYIGYMLYEIHFSPPAPILNPFIYLDKNNKCNL
jgi:hypothetical protein